MKEISKRRRNPLLAQLARNGWPLRGRESGDSPHFSAYRYALRAKRWPVEVAAI